MAKILIIEDDGALRSDLADQLAEWGHKVQEAVDGIHGLAMLEDWQPDIILSDVDMPRLSGIHLVQALRRSKSPYSGVSLFLMSSSTSSALVVSGIKSGAEDYLTKPLNYEILKAKLQGALTRREAILSEDRSHRLTLSIMEEGLHGVGFACAAGVSILVITLAGYWLTTVFGVNILGGNYL